MLKIDAANLLNKKESDLKEFCEFDIFNNNNKVRGYICVSSSSHTYGSLVIFEVNEEPTHHQVIYATPKIHYPFQHKEEEREYHWPRFKAINVYDKLDGCCDENVTLETERNGKKTIKEICETQLKDNVKAFDIDLQKEVFDKIINYSIKDNINDWYEITLENGCTIKLTATHKVWLPKLQCYREVKDLVENDEILFTKN